MNLNPYASPPETCEGNLGACHDACWVNARRRRELAYWNGFSCGLTFAGACFGIGVWLAWRISLVQW